MEKEKSPNRINERVLGEKFKQEMLTVKETKLQNWRVQLTFEFYDPLYRFFDFMKHNVKE